MYGRLTIDLVPLPSDTRAPTVSVCVCDFATILTPSPTDRRHVGGKLDDGQHELMQLARQWPQTTNDVRERAQNSDPQKRVVLCVRGLPERGEAV